MWMADAGSFTDFFLDCFATDGVPCWGSLECGYCALAILVIPTLKKTWRSAIKDQVFGNDAKEAADVAVGAAEGVGEEVAALLVLSPDDHAVAPFALGCLTAFQMLHRGRVLPVFLAALGALPGPLVVCGNACGG